MRYRKQSHTTAREFGEFYIRDTSGDSRGGRAMDFLEKISPPSKITLPLSRLMKECQKKFPPVYSIAFPSENHLVCPLLYMENWTGGFLACPVAKNAEVVWFHVRECLNPRGGGADSAPSRFFLNNF